MPRLAGVLDEDSTRMCDEKQEATALLKEIHALQDEMRKR
jgi:hypothetical protein